MMGIFEWIQTWPIAVEIGISPWLFPAIESIHVLAVVLVIGSIARVDLRLLGYIHRDIPITEVESLLLPWSWTSFAVAAITGGLLFTSTAVRYVENFWFDTKMILLALIFINMMYFEKVVFKSGANWNTAALPPFNVRLSGALSLIFWVGVITTGRLIGFT